MADYLPPPDLLQLRRDFQAADKAWGEATDAVSSQRAYQEAGRLAEAIQDHDWWGTVDDRFRARMALLTAAKD